MSHFLAIRLLILPSLSLVLSLFFSLSLSLRFLCLCSVLLWKPQHLYFKDVFVSLLCIQMIRLTGRRIQLWRRAVLLREEEEEERGGEPAFGVRLPPNQIFMRWWQLEECTANSPNTGSRDLQARLPSRAIWTGWVAMGEKNVHL